jgi:hypothetical protein
MTTHTSKISSTPSYMTRVERNVVDNAVLVGRADRWNLSERGVIHDDVAAAVALDILQLAELPDNEHFRIAINHLGMGIERERILSETKELDEEVRAWRRAVWGTPDSAPVLPNERESFKRSRDHFNNTTKGA